MLIAINPNEFQAVVNAWVESLELPHSGDSLQAVSIDGKVLCGTLTLHQKAIHLLVALDQETGCVLSQSVKEAETNEHKGAFDLLKILVLEGRVIVADAMFCQKDFCQRIRDGNGHYFVVVKDNQPQLKRDIQSAFAETEGFSPLHSARI